MERQVRAATTSWRRVTSNGLGPPNEGRRHVPWGIDRVAQTPGAALVEIREHCLRSSGEPAESTWSILRLDRHLIAGKPAAPRERYSTDCRQSGGRKRELAGAAYTWPAGLSAPANAPPAGASMRAKSPSGVSLPNRCKWACPRCVRSRGPGMRPIRPHARRHPPRRGSRSPMQGFVALPASSRR